MPELIGALALLAGMAGASLALAVIALVSGARWLVDKWTRGR